MVLVRKLRAPFNPEFAIGAIDEDGRSRVSEGALEAGADNTYLDRERLLQFRTLRARRRLYTRARPPINPAGRIAIVIDDGLATGATMIAALSAVRSKQPAELICAVPVASPSALARVGQHADETMCLHAPAAFRSVGQFYADFPQVDDAEVVELLQPAEEAC